MQTLRDVRAVASFAILASILLHLLLVRWVLDETVQAVRQPRATAVIMVHEPKPLPVKILPVKPPPPHVVVRQPPKRVKPVPIPPRPRVMPRKTLPPQVRSRPIPPPVMHFNSTSTDTGLGLDLTAPSSGNGGGSMTGFADSVRASIEAAKTYPPGIKGTWNECIVSYRATISAAGQLLHYKVFGCGNEFLDAATVAAILSAGPFTPPPNFGGSQYDVYGSLIYRQGSARGD